MPRIRPLVSALLAAIITTPANAAELSPDLWPMGKRAQAEQRDAFVYPTQLRTVKGQHSFISAVGSPIAIEAGMQVLREGGNAADAAVATALAQVTTAAGANVSFAGAVQVIYFEAATGKAHVLDGGWQSWSGEQRPDTIPLPDRAVLTGLPSQPQGIAVGQGRKTLVPGFIRGVAALRERFGTLAWRDLTEPARWYAEHGTPVSPLLRAYFGPLGAALGTTAEGKAFLAAGRSGDRFVAPELAETMRHVADKGPDYMYRGAWAEHFVAAVNAAGGKASMNDMRGYAARWSVPLATVFGDQLILASADGNQSACWILEALNIVEHRPITGNYWENAEAFRSLTMAMRFAQTAHYFQNVAAFEQQAGVGGSCAARTAPAYGAAVAHRLEALLASAMPAAPPSAHTNSLVVVDRWGNVAALVHSSNVALWGDSGIVVDGVPIPSAASTFRHLLIGAAPGNRVPSSMAPVMALKQGKPVLAIAHVGVSSAQETLRVIASLRTASLDRVITAPPLLLNVEQTNDPLNRRAEPVPVGAYSAELLAGLGLPIREMPIQLVASLRGTVALALIGDGAIRGVEAPGLFSFTDGE
jgi:gamma-glutamyltranspeptidase / glutathione hydrolase